MRPPGRKPQPPEVKRAKGEKRPSRLQSVVVEFPAPDVVPDAPGWLTYDAARELWEELAPVLVAQRTLSLVDVHALGHLCQLHGKIVDDISRRVAPTASETSQLRAYFSEFGLTPSSRARVPAADRQAQGNRFQRNGRRKD